MIRRQALATALAVAGIFSLGLNSAQAGDATKGQQVASGVCAGCHTPDGNSVIPTNPILAGQVEEYIVKQLKDFKLANGKPPARANPIMMAMTMALTEDDMKNVAAFYTTQKPKPAAAKDAQLAAVGQKLWRGGDIAKGIPACAGCHGVAGAGLPAQYPRLAGQHQDYTEAQLKAFRVDDRANDAEKVMRMIAAKMSDAEIKAAAEYIAGLR